MKRAWIGLVIYSFWANSLAGIINGTVVDVSDGDTITIIDNEKVEHKIRLSGIDAPEKAQPYGQKSKQSMSNMVLGKSVTVDTDKVDRYGREIGKVLVNGLDANLEQIKRGLAWHYKIFQRDQTFDDRFTYAAAEKEAFAKQLGLWQDKSPVAPWTWRHPVKTTP